MSSHLYLHLFHGRKDPNTDMDDWGFRGPTLGPFRYVQVIYLCDVKFAMEREAFKKTFPEVFYEWHAKSYSNAFGDLDPATGLSWIDYNLKVVNDLIEFEGNYYGDWSITTSPGP